MQAILKATLAVAATIALRRLSVRIGLIVALAFDFLNSGACLAALINVEPDLFSNLTDIRNEFPGVTLSVNGQPSVPVFAAVGDSGCGGVCSSTGTQVFRPGANPHWQFGLAVFRADFANLTDFVSIDFAGIDNGDVKAEIYDLSGVLLDSFITYIGAEGINTTATFNRPTADIAYILAGGVPGESVLLDHLTFDAAAVPEPSTLGLIGLGLLGLGAMRRRRRYA